MGLTLRLAQTDTRSSTVFVDEFDSRGFESPPDHVESGPARTARSVFQLMDSNGTNSGFLREILLAPGH